MLCIDKFCLHVIYWEVLLTCFVLRAFICRSFCIGVFVCMFYSGRLCLHVILYWEVVSACPFLLGGFVLY